MRPPEKHQLRCEQCGRQWWARYIPRSTTSPGEYHPDWCPRCNGDGHVIDEEEQAA